MRRLERARNEGSTGPNKLADSRSTEYAHADVLGVPCKPVNLGKGKSLGSPNRCAQIDRDRAGAPYPASPHIYECILLKHVYIRVVDTVHRAVGVVPGAFPTSRCETSPRCNLFTGYSQFHGHPMDTWCPRATPAPHTAEPHVR